MNRKCLMGLAGLLVACSGGGQTLQPDVRDVADVRQEEAAVETATPAEVDVAPVDVPPDPGVPETIEETTPACQPGSGCFLDPCADSGDCVMGPCVEHLGGKVCSQTCIEECPGGWTCKQLAGEGRDLVFACVSPFTHLCRPCASGADCKSETGVEDVCVIYGDEGSFCGADCQDIPCPPGYSCVDSVTTEGFASKQCKADVGLCGCSELSRKLGLSTPCVVTNAHGTCKGQRTCTGQGLSPCSAPAPALEVCNGLDDDCDGTIDGEICDDGDACTKDSCVAETGCQHEPLTGTSCDDGDVCTLADHCDDGTCTGSGIDCDDGNLCTSDSCDPTGGCVYTFNNTACDDSDPCTVGDSCKEGSCQGTSVPCDCQDDSDCAKLEDGNLCNGTLFCDVEGFPQKCAVKPTSIIECPAPSGIDAPCLVPLCDPFNGQCSFAAANDGKSCDDGKICTTGSHCVAGTCAGGIPLNCEDGNLCTDDSCDPVEGCIHLPNSLPCEDGNPCTMKDTCEDAACSPGQPANCNDGNPCTDDSCDPTSGCIHQANAAPCDDGNVCTTGDKCQNKGCKGIGILPCSDGNLCTDDSCDPTAGCQHANNSLPCSDGNPCTPKDVCMDGACVGMGVKDCGDGNPCTDDACHPTQGCLHQPNTAACNDNNLCTTSDVCANGACTGTGLLACSDSNHCTDDSCNPAKGCIYTPNKTSCDDGNECTLGDVCKGGQCSAGTMKDCEDGNPCTKDSCVPLTGCMHVPGAGLCDDGNPCTIADKCAAGTCQPGAPKICDDGNFCTDDSCGKEGICQFVPNKVACNDANSCTNDDLCADGKCAGTPIDCDDGNPCTKDSCAPATGCVYTFSTAPCDDGNLCTTKDVCDKGACTGSVALPCDDANPCTDDSCDPKVGCLHKPNQAQCDDANACTLTDQCSAGWCQGLPLGCDDDDPCTTDSCNPATGCVHTTNTAPCDDGNLCTVNDTCQEGMCVGGKNVSCNDSNDCTDDSCDPAKGCTHSNNNGACTDANFCTEGDSCVGGNCIPGSAVTCNDAEVCTTDACLPKSGCSFTPVPNCCHNDAECNDGNPATTDKCSNNQCKHLTDPGLPHNSAPFSPEYTSNGGCGDYSKWYTRSFGQMTFSQCEAKANLTGAQYVGAPNLYDYTAPYASSERWVGDKDVTNGYVSAGGWDSVGTRNKNDNSLCVLGYANGNAPGNSTLTDSKVVNGRTYQYKDFGTISEKTCYDYCREYGARPLNPQYFGVSGVTHMVENHSCHGSVQYNGNGYTTDGSGAHTYRCFIGYYSE
ncbi:MAG: hypothetical protein FJ109_00155 [Deltaproteobacteria bacterium]|nr:hypothetical protein [Deltaproteobacteria bacterium]